MSKFVKISILAIAILMMAALITGCSTRFSPQEKKAVPAVQSPVLSSNGPTNGLVQSNTGGAVTIDVEWRGNENGSLVFNVAMNTHSVDLDRYDLGELAILRSDDGKEYHPISWDSPLGGHHRRGTLIFSTPDSLSQGKARYLELIIRDVAQVRERLLRWELG